MTPQQVVDVLNEVLTADPAAANGLFKQYVPCNQAIVDHPTVIVAGSNEQPLLGVLGLINGLVGLDRLRIVAERPVGEARVAQ